ncbi:MAG: hypothetical protein CSA38_03480 [Flavobacteriales bacterium]|nr:MAG: hypothetical protein CSA38_03480 [Flavobacteriales bacterium]
MKNKLWLGIIALTLFSCEEKKESVKEETKEVAQQEQQNLEQAPVKEPIFSPIRRQEKLIKEAQEKPLTNLVISENHFDFKDIKQGETVEHQFEFTNSGKKPLIISAVKPGCGCTISEYTQEPILPGKKGFVTLKFNAMNFQGMVRKSAEVYANVEQLPIVLTFSANVIPQKK